MSRAKPGYTGDPAEFPLDTLDYEERLAMVEKLKDFYPANLPDDWDDFTELDLAARTGQLIPRHIADPAERFCHYIYYSAAQVVADHMGDELSTITPAEAGAEVLDLCSLMKKVLRILPKRPTTVLPVAELENLGNKCRGASDSTIRAIYTNDEIQLSDRGVDADLLYVSDVTDDLLDLSTFEGLSDLRTLLRYFVPQLESAIQTNRAEARTLQPKERRQRLAVARVRIAEQVSYVLETYGLGVSTYHSVHGAEHESHRWEGSSDLVQILCLLGKVYGIGGSGQTWSEVVRKI